MNCVYRVEIPAGKAMNISFNDFNLENAHSCRYDYLKIANEKSETFGGLNGKYCGIRSGTVLVTGQYAVFTFQSDSSVTRRGYHLTFTFVPTGFGCGYLQNNQLTSPGYPNVYPNRMDCTYWVYIPLGRTLRIYFRDFEVESHPSCRYDYLRITNERNVTFGKYCGVKTGRTVSVTGRYAVITFHSDTSFSGRGYNLTFSSVNSGSGTQGPPTGYPTNPPWFTTAPPNGNATQVPPTVNTTNRPWYTTAPPQVGCGYVQNNQLTSPGYPNFYPNGMDCTYRVYIRPGGTLRIYFRDFEVESHPSCRYDYLRITNERNVTFGKYCGVKTGRTVSVTGRYAVITFHSDGSERERGYNLTFSSVNSVFTTPRPSSVYPTAGTAFPSIGPSPDAKSKLQYLINVFRYLLNQMEYVVNNEVPTNSSVSVREYKARVQRAVADVHDALQAEGRQKRDVGSVEMISQLEKKADDLITRLQIKEDRYKRSALKRKVAIRNAKKAH
ncbi:bone morphogenetic protein 1-like isoform X2 [Stylophora pistillata]|nr:bone morphogenetic protein 1-like isoform X2 [Stylophora pistillata]